MLEYVLIFLVNLIYLPSLWYGLVSDDAVSMVTNPFPIKRTKGFNILLHILVAEYIYIAFGCSGTSFLVALLFSTHPMGIQVPIWIAGRQYGINALLFLMIWKFAPWGVLFYPLSWETSCATLVFTPLVFLCSKYWYLALATPIVFWLSWRKIVTGVKSKIKGSEFTPGIPKDFELTDLKPKKIIIAVKTFWYYSLVCFLPLKNGFYNSYLQTFGSSQKATDYWYSLNRHFWGGVAVIVAMLYLLVTNLHNNIGVGIMLFVTAIAPFLNFISPQQFTAPRYAYLALIGILLCIVSFLATLGILTQLVVVSGLYAFYLTKLVKVMRHYRKTNVEMIHFDTWEFPDNPRIWYFRYEHMLHKNNPIMAWSEAQWGLRFCPEDSQLWFGLSCASFELGDYNAAREFLKNAEKYMILADRKSMIEVIEEMKYRIDLALQGKWKHELKRRF
jgi:hypothetical protein